MVPWENLEGEVNGVHVHGEGSASGGSLVWLFEPEALEHAEGAVVTDNLLSADGDAIGDEPVNPSGDDGEVETASDLVAELGEIGGVVTLHTEHAPDSELAGQVTVR